MEFLCRDFVSISPTQLLFYMQDGRSHFHNLRELFNEWHNNDIHLEHIRAERDPTPEEIEQYESVRFRLEDYIKSLAPDDRIEYLERIKRELDHLK